MRNQIKVKVESCEKFEVEIASIRKIGKSSTLLNQEEINQKGSLLLDNLLASQKQSSDKGGVGLEKGQSSKVEQRTSNGESSRISSSKTQKMFSSNLSVLDKHT